MKPQPKENFNRPELRLLFKELGFKIGAEIGVFRGRHAEQLCIGIPDLRLYCIDPWMSYPLSIGRVFATSSPQSQKEPVYQRQEVVDSWYRYADRRLRKYNTIIIRKTSVKAVKNYPEGFFDFVHIDGDHSYQSVIDDLTEWSKRVRVGGIVSGHDYDPDWGVKKAVDDYVEWNKIDNCFYSVEKKISPSFWWIKK